jgi:ribosome recycling factor
MIDRIIAKVAPAGDKIAKHLTAELATLVVGRAAPALLDGITVEQYGAQLPVKSAAQVNVEDAQSLVVSPWDKQMLGPIEKAIQSANLGFSVVNNGESVRVILPPPSQERRDQMLKVVASKTEQAKISLRNLRHESLEELKKVQGVSKDEISRGEDTLQKEIVRVTAELDRIAQQKEDEISKI